MSSWRVLTSLCLIPETEKKTTCEGPSSRNISFYHLMCLVAKSQGYPPEGVPPEDQTPNYLFFLSFITGCKYETVCELYRPESAVAAKTTTPITTATSATSAATSSSLNTTPAAPTTTAPPPSTPAPTTTASPPSTPPPTPTLVPVTTTDKHEGGNANSSTGTRESTNTKVMCLLIISVTLNFVLPLVVFLFMRQRTQHRTQNPPHQDESSVLDETCEDPDPLPLIQSTTKPDVHSPSADTPRNPCTAGNGLGSH
ncbi:mucin-5AC-like [Platichthys flesus]|uniref:mucin-5AC-like n=1 Tax=Platichthys flesus TaxID=8260 RepID=UPI002DBF233E|nr:mucin-5AC-like [Platichthys flesus]